VCAVVIVFRVPFLPQVVALHVVRRPCDELGCCLLIAVNNLVCYTVTGVWPQLVPACVLTVTNS